MKTANVTLEFISEYSQGKFHETEKLNKEGHAEYEQRTWKEKAHWGRDGKLKVPGMSLKLALEEAAKRLGTSLKVPGKTAKETYTKYIKSGIGILDDGKLDITRETVEMERCFIPSSSSSKNRVMKYFPLVAPGHIFDMEITVWDDIITKEAFEEIIEYAGRFIGLGRFRVGNGGMYGRFIVNNISWS